MDEQMKAVAEVEGAVDTTGSFPGVWWCLLPPSDMRPSPRRRRLRSRQEGNKVIVVVASQVWGLLQYTPDTMGIAVVAKLREEDDMESLPCLL
jgi:hypothetical protein